MNVEDANNKSPSAETNHKKQNKQIPPYYLNFMPDHDVILDEDSAENITNVEDAESDAQIKNIDME
ncbi:MAG TPA: hypothetical protein VNM69_05660 [Bacillus sp. (in: firmicutes)]|uniref:hypothetical protein n=1 Tax=Bacillus litorisediminis TaxID=2922713 RepID=UPI001FAD612C|nr:hypothetical protein [Bacillus litorisediminis]HWO75392.1 hypothetical protein [Bacillus sp. (in: firmicutes)]